MPKEVIESKQGGPYTTRTLLGWVVNGPLCNAGEEESSTFNFISAEAKLTEQFEKFCNLAFNDSVYVKT